MSSPKPRLHGACNQPLVEVTVHEITIYGRFRFDEKMKTFSETDLDETEYDAVAYELLCGHCGEPLSKKERAWFIGVTPGIELVENEE